MNDFKTYLAHSGKNIQQEIEKALTSLSQANSQLTTEYKLFSESMQGGKGIRGMLVKLGYRIAVDKENSEINKVAAAFEILHASLLIHDDVIDKSLIRRGRPTAYKALGGNHYGISQAICLGDTGFFLATKLIAESRFDSELKVRVLSLFSEIVMDTITGEMLDVKLSLADQEKREEDVLTIHKLKTAYYTIVGPLTIGALFGQANSTKIRAIKQFGEYIGMAFQIQDDVLGTFGEEKAVGKSTTSDIEENKNTLLIAYALEKATIVQRKILNKHYGKGKITSSQYAAVKKVFIDTGALAYSQMKTKEYINLGKKVIPLITKEKDVRGMLNEFTDLLINRQN